MTEQIQKMLNREMLMIGLSLLLGGGIVAGCSTSSVENSNGQASIERDAAPLTSANVSKSDNSDGKTSDQAGISEAVSVVEPDTVSQAIASTPAPAPSTGENTKDNASEQQLNSDPIETADLATLTLNLADAQGKPYGEVRDRIIASGWRPHTFAETTGPDSEFRDSRVQEMEGLGFMEVKACSGTGQGFCRFEFVYEERTADNAPILAVTTTAASLGDANYPMPNFWSVRQENISDLTYGDRPFDQALFTQLREQEGFCLGVGQCEQAQYIFNDALLIAATGGFGTATMSLIPDVPVSKEEAIAYARVLDTEGIIDFDNAELDSTLNIEHYYEAGLLEDAVDELGGITTVKLQLTPDGQVSEISFSVIVL